MNSKRKKILLIDQHPEWLDFAEEVLQEDYDIVKLSNHADLLSLQNEVGKTNGFNLIFIGLELVTNNLDVLRPLFKQWQFVVVFPVIQENETVRLLFKAGVYDCTRKPYDRDGLLKLVADELVAAEFVNGHNKIKPTKKTRQEIKKQLSAMLKLEDE
jgi:DNA-binding NtrC family response regulator